MQVWSPSSKQGLPGRGHWDDPKDTILRLSPLQEGDAAQGRGGKARHTSRVSLKALPPQIQHTEDMENEIDELLQEFEEKSGRAFLHTVCFY